MVEWREVREMEDDIRQENKTEEEVKRMRKT